MSWQTAKIGDLLAKVKRAGKLQANQYQETGRFPVIDQGQNDIAGYSDNAEIVHTEPLPIVIFGDHTRRVKLAREPFICGADGTQLLYPKDDDLDPVFFFYTVKNVDLSNYAYARHFKFLKDQDVSYPDVPTQQRIAGILSAYDDLIENNRRRIGLLEQAARLLYREWFVHLRFPGHEMAKIADGLPEGWEKTTLGKHCPLIYGKALKAETRVDGPFDVYGSSGIVGTHSKALTTGPAIIVGRKGNVGSVYWARRGFWPIDTVYFVDPASSDFFTFFVLKNTAFQNTDVAVPGLNRDYAHTREIKLPPKELIQSFNDRASVFLRQAEFLSSQNDALTRARDLLLPRLMDGRIPV